MTIKSIILGFLASLYICIICYINDKGIRCGTLIQHMLPSIAYGSLVVFALFINPILRTMGRKIAMTKAEVAVVLAFVLITCGIPGWNLGNMFSCAVMQPHHFNRTTPAWRSMEILSYAPADALCDISGPKGEEVALNGFVTGLGEGDKFINFMDIPWGAWRAPFIFWGPLIISFLVAVFGLSVVFHRQWSVHEQLPYPIIQFATSMLPDEDGRLAPIFRNRMFLIGFIATFLLFFNNYGVRCWPEYLIPIQTQFNLWPFAKLFQTVLMGQGGRMFYPQLLFTVIGLAYFLPSEASFTMWIGPWIYCLVVGIFASYGVRLQGGKMMELVPELFIFSGGFFGIFLLLLYTGRHFYWNTLKKALYIRTRDDIPDYSVFGMRVFLIAIAIFVILVHFAGIHWSVGIPYTILSLMVYIGVSRVLAETGAFEVGSYVYPCVFLWGIMGASALGPRVLLMMFLLSTMLLSTPGWCTMPFINQGLRVADKANVPMKKLSHWGVLVTVIAIFVAIPATIYWQYMIGAPSNDWSSISAKYPFDTAIELVQTLRLQGLEEAALSRTGFDHWLHISPDWKYVGIFVLSTMIALGIAFGRLKYSWWPFHPIICIFFGGHQAMKMSFSFGVGWLLKCLITKYGGGRLYQECKPLFVGMIAGTLAEELVQMVIGTCFYFITGTAI